MTVRVNKSSFNIREKLSELERPIGLKGSELMRSETVQEARDFISAGRKNLIINGRFDFWQRGTSFTGTEYTADRWQQSLSGGTATVSRQAFTLGQTEVPGNPTYYLQQSCSVGNGNCGIDQKIEDVRTGAGGPVTISFWAKGTNPGIGYWSMQLWQRFGSGGSPSGTVQNNKQLTVTSDWKKYSFTYELASISGKTLGTANNSNLNLIIRQNESDSSTSAWELNIANVQVEFGKNATEFEHRSYGEELALCQRYYWKTEDFLWLYSLDSGHNYVRCNIFHPVEMRTTPTVTGSFSNAGTSNGFQGINKKHTIPYVNTPGSALTNLTAGAQFSAEL
jgi:hypothetical protein